MSALDREAIFSALYSRLKAQVPSVRLFSRRFLPYDSLKQSDLPSLELIQEGDVRSQAEAEPPRWTLNAWIVLYVMNTDKSPDTTPDSMLNQIELEIEKALTLQFGESSPCQGWETTLGGLVIRCGTSGDSQRTQGNDGGRAWTRIPISLTAVATTI